MSLLFDSTIWRPTICIWRLFFSTWSPNDDLRIFLISSPGVWGSGECGLKDSRHFLIQSEAKLKPIVPRSRMFSRALRRLCLRVTIHGSLDCPGYVLCDWLELLLWLWFKDTIERLVARSRAKALKVRLTAILLFYIMGTRSLFTEAPDFVCVVILTEWKDLACSRNMSVRVELRLGFTQISCAES